MPVTVFPTGTTIYDPQKAWSGFTILSTIYGDVRLIDMNGNVVNCWEGFRGFPNKILPGGYLMGSSGMRNSKYGFQDQLDLVQVDWSGKPVWKFCGSELISDPGEKPRRMARQHHDYQREGNPVGYYVPGMDPFVDKGKTLILCHKNVRSPAISDKLLLDDIFVEVDWQGGLLWQWNASDHFAELGFSPAARRALRANPNMLTVGEGFGDWMHINSLSRVGPNAWYDQGDARFHPENLIFSSRQANILAIVDKKTGKVVWRVGPDYKTGALKKLGYIIGPHHAHIVPRGLPGEGNLLVFDNGGWAGYGNPNPGSRGGVNVALRDSSRVLEINPVTLDIVWQYTAKEAGFFTPIYGHKFYSSLVSSAQRLPNGNTLITEGVEGRLLEVTRDHRIVWEYVNPTVTKEHGSLVYRSYRVPYAWVPQGERTVETAVIPPGNGQFRLPGTQPARILKSTPTAAASAGAEGPQQFCVLPEKAK